MKVVDPRPRYNFVCPWCGTTRETREGLDEHWRLSRSCGKNKNVSNQTKSKYVEPGVTYELPGARVLRLVEENTTE